MDKYINSFYFFLTPAIIGPILGVVFSVLIVELIIPCMRQKRKKANIKLRNFYNVAYAFVKIREDFSVIINGIMHNKENCGFFHNFNEDYNSSTQKSFDQNGILVSTCQVFDKISGILFDENKFFDFVAKNFDSIDDDLKKDFIEYFKARGPENIQKGIGCNDSKLIRLRKDIERRIIFYYEKYSDIVR